MGKGRLLAVIGTVVLVAVIWMLPTKSEAVLEKTPVSGVNEKVNKAVEIINSGSQPPMAGIKLLREVLEEDPKNEEALFYMGYFSVQSGQYDKAVVRFNEVLEVNPQRYEARYLLGMSHLELKDTIKALSYLEEVAKSEGEKELKESALRAINELNKL